MPTDLAGTNCRAATITAPRSSLTPGFPDPQRGPSLALILPHDPVQEQLMYSALIGAGVSALWDVFKSQTGPSTPASAPDPAPAQTPSLADPAKTTGTGAASSLSSHLHGLLIDLQAGSTGSGGGDATNAVSGDLQKLFKDLHASGGHHRHETDAQTASGAADSSAANPFQKLAASLLAYSKSASAGASQSTSTSLTA